MSKAVLAVVKNGKIEPISPIDLPEGTSLLIKLHPSNEALEWSAYTAKNQQNLLPAIDSRHKYPRNPIIPVD
jgi:predicted DNA-binding antitoxin AbrB/MazE fold protein